MNEYTLVVMAAGLGSRFGGAKQVMPVDDDENFIIDYSVYDAIRAGFKKVVFIIKEEDREIFDSTIGNRIKDKIQVEYACQKKDDIPSSMDISKRVKPWGTVQAVLCSKQYVNGGFVVINADDFYGFNSYKNAFNFLSHVHNNNEYALISYPFSQTIWGSEAVKRGVLTIEHDRVSDIIESSIQTDGGRAIVKPLDGSDVYAVGLTHPVSMNMFAFQKDVYSLLDEYFKNFFKQDEEVIMNSEALLPEMLKQYINSGRVIMHNVNSNSTWMGMTYREDLENVKKELNALKSQGMYPKHLWF